MTKVKLILLLTLFLQGCKVSHHYSIESYKKVSTELQKAYKLKRGGLILSYDLAYLDNTNCIFSRDLGLVANESGYASSYLKKFKSTPFSNSILLRESKIKIKKVSDLLISLHRKYKNKALSDKSYNKVKKLAEKDLTQVNAIEELAGLDSIASHIPLLLPAYNPCFASCYGNRKHPVTKKRKMHCGVDLVALKNAPIYASASGTVSFIGTQNGYGATIEINHGNNIKTKYAHLKKILVQKGQKVIRGQAIALQGASGNAKRDHLHFEIHLDRKHVNPYDFIGHNYECAKR